MKTIVRDFVRILEQRLGESGTLIQVVLGPRQVGKTTGIKQCLAAIKRPSLYVSADDLMAPNHHWLAEQWQKALLLSAGSILVIDEIQKISNWQERLKDLWDNHNPRSLHVVVLGSSSFEIQQGMKESLAGRYEELHVPHWSAGESAQVGVSLEKHLVFGGYPASYRFIGEPDRWQAYLRDSIIENVLNKDIFRLRPLAKPMLFRQFVDIIRAYPCQEISYTKLLGQLQDRGNVELVKHYLFLLECAFLYKGLEKYSRKEYLKKGSSPKILPLCPALSTYSGALSSWGEPDRKGRLFEAAVGAVLCNQPGALHYWRDGKHEVDYVYEYDGVYAIEVKSGRKRAGNGMSAFLAAFPDARPVFISPGNYQAFEAAPLTFIKQVSGQTVL